MLVFSIRALRQIGERMVYAGIAMRVVHFANHDLVTVEPSRLRLLGADVRLIFHRRLKGSHGVPIIDIRDKPGRSVLPILIAQVARDRLRDLDNRIIDDVNASSNSPFTNVKVDVYKTPLMVRLKIRALHGLTHNGRHSAFATLIKGVCGMHAVPCILVLTEFDLADQRSNGNFDADDVT